MIDTIKNNKALRVLVFVILGYVGLVVLFESLLGFFQPAAGNTMLITTYNEAGEGHDRVVARLESGGQLYVAVNHWPRAWYRQALANPRMTVSYDDTVNDYSAVPLEGAEYDRVNSEHGLGLAFRVLTGFPPRHILRLDPR